MRGIYDSIMNAPIPDIVKVSVAVLVQLLYIVFAPLLFLKYKSDEKVWHKRRKKRTEEKKQAPMGSEERSNLQGQEDECKRQEKIARKRAQNCVWRAILSPVIVSGLVLLNLSELSQVWVKYGKPLWDPHITVITDGETEQVTEEPVMDTEKITETENQKYGGSWTIPASETEEFYSTECRMYLEILPKWVKLSQEEENQVFFGLLSLDLEENSEEVIYEQMERELLGRIGMKKKDLLQEDELWESMEEWIEYQNQVLVVTGQNDDFIEEMGKVKEDLSWRIGTWEWYRLLPKSNVLFSIIQTQEDFIEKTENIELAQQLYNNFWLLGKEYELQERENACYGSETVKRCYLKAALYLLKKLEFEECTLNNCYKTLTDLKRIFERISDYEGLGKNDPQKKAAKLIGEMLENFIQERLEEKSMANDPIVMRGHQ